MKTKLILLILLHSIIYAGTAQAGERIDIAMDADAGDVFDMEIMNGDLTIYGTDRDEIRIRGELSDGAEGYEFERRGGVIQFEEEYEDRRRYFSRNCDNWFNCGNNAGRADLEVAVPRGSTVRLEGINVELNIKDIEGNTEVEIINGPIVAQNLSGRISLETVNGTIDTRDLNGRINLATINGRIDDIDSNGERVSFSAVNGRIESNTKATRLNAESVSGSIDLVLGEVEDLEAQSVSGTVRIEMGLAPGGQVELSSVSGRIELDIDPKVSARFDINTAVGGRISNNLTGDEPTRENRFVNSSELLFRLGDGNGNVDISTVTGNITLNPKR